MVYQMTNSKSHRKLKLAGGSAMKGIIRILLLSIFCTILASCDDFYISETEPNDSFETANPIVASTVKGSISVAGDKDYWKIRVNQGETYYFELSGLEDDLQLIFYPFSLTNTAWDRSIESRLAQLLDRDGLEAEGFTYTPDADLWLQFLVEGSGETDGDEISKYKFSYSIL